MQDFYRLIVAWQPFFISLAAISATLVGLLFVAISLHPGGSDPGGKANLQRLAQHTFADFVQVLFVGFFLSVPEMVPTFYGAAMLLIVAVSLRPVWVQLSAAWRDRIHAPHRQHLLRRLGLSLLGRVLLLVGAGELLLLQPNLGTVRQSVFFVFSGSVVLLISAMRNAWFLLLQDLE
ncbi:MAG: hypothetical protein WBR15_05970 [Gammaproteobacteria bacterium]